ncbi:PKD-like domain-containing protein [Aquimarina sediminis]|uniref:PKD-like domain-containing protein n=1 Tax=Aquimarina sediminis TaxID=2070536 RepID=UPI000CA014C2|nr:PKD-like domain-containing protein [Aquimarina sediminis]
MEKKYVFLVLLLHLSFVSVAQLSDLHYLPPLKQYTNNNAIVQQSIYLSTPETTAFDVRVYRGNSGTVLTTLTGLSNTNSIKYDLASGDNNITLVTNANTGVVLSNGGLRFESSGGKKFYVNYRGRHSAQAASLTSKGKSAMGTKFKWGGIPLRSTTTGAMSATLGIMATVDNTTIDIYGYDPDCVFRQGTNAAGITSDSVQITLNAGQSYVLEAILSQAAANLDGWLGATIESDKDIVISNGGLLNMVLAGSASRDAGIDQPVPEDIIGKDYVFVRGNGVNGMEIPIIIATQDNTEIFVNGSATPIATINNGDYFDIPSSNYSGTSAGANMLVTTSERAYAYQALAGSSSQATGGLNFIAPVNCLMPKELDNIPDIRNVAGKNFTGGVTIIASTTTLDANIVVTDGTGTVTLPASTPVAGSTDWKTFFVSGLTGDVSVQSTGPISVGFLGANSSAGIAGYFSGFDTAPVVNLQITGGGCLPGGTVEEITGSFDAYQWFMDGVLVSGATSSSYTPPPTVTFAELFVRVTQGSCTFDSDPLAVYDCSPDIVLSKTADAASYEIGDTVTYTITVESKGVNPVTNLVVTDNIPSGLTLVSATPDFGSWSAPNWTVGTINSGEKYTLTIQATVDSPAAFSTITNTITNTQDQTDSNNTADDPSETITIVADNDGDGIYDSVDLDDDNDGILDTDEGACSTRELWDSTLGTGSITIGGKTVNYTTSLTGPGSITGSNNTSGHITFNNGGSAAPTVWTITFDEWVTFEAFSKTTGAWFDNGETWIMSAPGATFTVDNPDNSLNLATGVYTNEITFASPVPGTNNNKLWTINTNYIKELTISYQQPASNSGAIQIALNCIDPDSDNDGIQDRLDVDSDNDGCNDALEADENVVAGQLDANGRINITTQGGIDGSGVPNLVNTGGTADIGGDQGQGVTGNETIATTIQIDTQPTNSTICLGLNTTFSVVASSLSTTTYTGTPPATIPDYSGSLATTAGLVYQWQEQVAGAGAWSDLSNGGVYSNTTTATLTLTNPPESASTNKYRLIITSTNNVCSNVTSSEVALVINPVPTVATPPTETICSDVALNHDLTADVSSAGTTFSWLAADNSNVTGETTSASTASSITDTLINTSGSVQTVIYTITPTGSNGCVGDAYTYTVTVNPQPLITSVTTNTDICEGEDAIFTIAGSPSAVLTYNLDGNPNQTITLDALGDAVVTKSSTTINSTINLVSIEYSATSCSTSLSNSETVIVNSYPTLTTATDIMECASMPLQTLDANNGITYGANISIQWFDALSGGNVVANPTHNVIGSISYYAEITNTTTSCVNPTRQEIELTLVEPPFPDFTETVCSDEALNVSMSTFSSSYTVSSSDPTNVPPGPDRVTPISANITDTYTNTTGVPVTITYTVTIDSPVACQGEVFEVIVTVNPEPSVATAPTDTVCSDVALNHDLTSDVDLAGSSFSWQAADNVNVTGETITASATTSITDVLTNTSGSVQTVIYTITPTGSNGCVGDVYTYTVTVNPEPSVATAPTDTVCSDVALNHDLTSDVDLAGSTFSWQAADNVNVTGETITASATTSITDVLTNTSGSVQTVIYTITPTGSNGCVGDAYTYTVTVNPEPSVATAPTDTVCSDVALNHDLTSDVDLTGSTFSWQAADNVNVTGETTSAATATSITDVLTNTSGSVQTVIYTITPTGSNGCVGDAYTYTVTVNPEPSVATAPTDTVCSDVALNHDLTSDVDLAGSTFSWQAADNVNVTGETTSAATTTSITDVLTNTSGSVQTVIYTITPTGSNGCVGDAYTYTVTVNPEPSVATAPTDTVCSDVALNHDLTSDVDLAGSTFSWQAADNANVTGETTSATTTTSITDVLTNTSGSVQTVIYTITPTGSNGCVGDAYTYTVTVNPEPSVATAPTDTVCSDVALNHDLTSDVDLAGSTFSWQAADNVNITGETTSATTTTSITDVLTNTSGSVQTVIYTITPTGSNGCVGDAYTYTVTVNPEPSVATAPTDTVCSDVALNHDLTSDVDLAGSTFSWQAADNVNITGETTSAATTTSITDVLTNTSGSVQTVIYTITPTGSNGCVGDAYTYTVTVNPEPSVATAPTDTVCSDVALNHDLTSDVDLAGSSFSWQAADNVNVTGETTSAATATSITDVLTNTSGSVQTVIYTITPTGSNGCVGDAYTYTVTVNPEPSVATAPTDTVCSDVALNHDLTSDVDLGGTTFTWQATDNANVTGETISATTTTSITDVLTNTSGSVQTVIYTITPTGSNGCVGDAYTYTVVVLPSPELIITKESLVPSDGAYDTVGEEIMYEIIVSNPREVDLNSIVVTDANAEFISSPNIPVLTAYSSITLMARHTITQSDLDNGTVTNTATVEGQDPCGIIATDTSDDPNTTAPNDPTVTQLSQKPSLSLLKSSDVAPDGLWDELGEIITYSLELTNTGNVTLTNVVITDSNADAGSISPSNIVSIAPDETISIVAAHTITQSDLDNGSVSNTASVQAQDPNGGSVTDISDDPNNSEDNDADGDGDPDDITITHTPQQGSLDITKEVNETTYMNIGDVISYTIEVTNTGNVTLFDVTVIDPIVNFTSSNMISALAPNESVIIGAEHIVDQQDIINEMVVNTAVVNALLPDLTSSISEDSDDPNDFSNVDTDGDGDFDDPTVVYLDIDGDGIINLDDLDDDNDGITDIEEQNEDPNLDTDDDGIIDRLDLDADGDGVLDVYESGANLEGLTVSNEGRIEGNVGTDGIPDGVQNTGEINDGTVNYSIQDTDGDGIDDFQDIDDDNDGILTADENPDPNDDGNPDDAFDTDGNGIPDYLEPNVPTDGGEDGITIFTGMSPNGDGVNDVLVISGIEGLENTLEIYNRWGVKVFGAKNYGRNNNFFSGISVGRSTVEDTDQLPVGTYYYVLEYVLESGEQKSRVGYIYINR